jgi:hypothetical protein
MNPGLSLTKQLFSLQVHQIFNYQLVAGGSFETAEILNKKRHPMIYMKGHNFDQLR